MKSPEEWAEEAQLELERCILIHPDARGKIREIMARVIRDASKEAIKNNRVPAATEGVWNAYSTAYKAKYGHLPLDNVELRSMMKNYLKKVPISEAEDLVRFFVNHPDKFYTLNRHPFGFLLRDVQRLHSEWKRGGGGPPPSPKTAHAQSQLERIRRGEL